MGLAKSNFNDKTVLTTGKSHAHKMAQIKTRPIKQKQQIAVDCLHHSNFRQPNSTHSAKDIVWNKQLNHWWRKALGPWFSLKERSHKEGTVINSQIVRLGQHHSQQRWPVATFLPAPEKLSSHYSLPHYKRSNEQHRDQWQTVPYVTIMLRMVLSWNSGYRVYKVVSLENVLMNGAIYVPTLSLSCIVYVMKSTFSRFHAPYVNISGRRLFQVRLLLHYR